MSKAAKIWLITAGVLTALGGGVFTGALAANRWDPDTADYKTQTYEVSADFKKIDIDVTSSDIVFAKSNDKKCRVEFYESENIKHAAKVEDGSLNITEEDKRKWYDYFVPFMFKKAKTTIYLPSNEYAALTVDAKTGNTDIPEGFTFNEIDIDKTSGKTYISGVKADMLSIDTTTGDVRLDSVKVGGDIDISVTTGDVSFRDVTADGDLSVKGVTGDVLFENSDAKNVTVKTTTGDVEGNLLTDKAFTADTTTGKVRVPDSSTGGRCEISTTTGDITIDIGKK